VHAEVVVRGRGEAEAIALAAERKGTVLLIDEGLGRRVAARLGIEVRGTLGLLLQGHRAGAVPDLERAIGRMRERGSWVGDDLVAAVLAASRGRSGR
jgi:predicted nucleic acid-binding protein